MQQQYPRGLRVLVCGGGNAAHVLAGSLSARGATTTLLSTFPGEADAIRLGLQGGPTATDHRGIAVNHWSLDRSGTNFGTLRGTPVSVASRVESAFTPSSATPAGSSFEYYDCIVLALPGKDLHFLSDCVELRIPRALCDFVRLSGTETEE